MGIGEIRRKEDLHAGVIKSPACRLNPGSGGGRRDEEQEIRRIFRKEEIRKAR